MSDIQEFDPLTFLRTEEAFKRDCAALPAGYCAITLFDLDRFKRVNDKLGHVAGDDALVLTGLAFSLANSIRLEDQPADSDRYYDAAYRIHGDEFAALLDGGSEDPEVAMNNLLVPIKRLARAMSNGVNAYRFTKPGVREEALKLPASSEEREKKFFIGASFGFIVCRAELIRDHSDQVVNLADRLIYQAKQDKDPEHPSRTSMRGILTDAVSFGDRKATIMTHHLSYEVGAATVTHESGQFEGAKTLLDVVKATEIASDTINIEDLQHDPRYPLPRS